MAEAHEAFERFEKTHHHAGGHGDDDNGGLATKAALSVAVIAAFLAIATFLGNETVNEAIQNQTKSSDANAQSISFATQQEVAFLNNAVLTSLSVSSDPKLAAAAKAGADSLDKSSKQFAPAEKQLNEQVKEAKKETDDANSTYLIFEIAEVLLQISIVVASVSIIAKRSFLLYGGWAAATVGVGVLIVGLLV